MVNRKQKPVLPTWVIGLWAVLTFFICIFLMIVIFFISQKNLHSPSIIISPPTIVLPALISHNQPTPTNAITPSPTTVPTPTETPTLAISELIENRLAKMDLHSKIGQLLMIRVNTQSASYNGCSMVQQLLPGAIVYLGENTAYPDQVRRFTSELQSCSETVNGIPLLIAIDHEGYYVTRFESGVSIFPPALGIASSDNPDLAYLVALASGSELAYSGINMVLGPVADVLIEPDNSVISQRSFGSNPQKVSLYISKSVQGYQNSKVIPVLKHFPGHGGSVVDSHDILPLDMVDRISLDQTYLPPFIAGLDAGAQVVMLNHVAYPNLTQTNLPSTQSAGIIELLRSDLRFSGVILSDAMSMGAITNRQNVPEAALEAIKAGVTMLILDNPEDAFPTRDLLIQAVEQGELSLDIVNAAVNTNLSLKATNNLLFFPVVFGPEPDWAENQSLVNSAAHQSIVLFRDTAGLIPIPPDIGKIRIIGPYDSWGLYPKLVSALESHGFHADVTNFDYPAGPDGYDLTIVLTWDSHQDLVRGYSYQEDIVSVVLNQGPVIVISLKSPIDILDFPNVSTCLSTIGTSPEQIDALGKILTGELPPIGKNQLDIMDIAVIP